MTVFGWDASDFDWDRNGSLDLVSAKAAGVDFFTHKITEGTHTKHWHCGEALARARDAGIEFLGVYVVVRTGPVGPQVDYALAELGRQVPWWNEHPGFFFQVDLEHWDYDKVAPEQGAEMCRQLHERTGRWVVLYAPKWAYGNTIPGDDPLWASDYGTNPVVELKAGYPGDKSSRWVAYSGRTPVFLQYGSRLTIGHNHTCDGNAYRGTVAELRALITGSTQEDDMTPDEHNNLLATDARVYQALLLGSKVMDDVPGAGPGTPVYLPTKLEEIEAKVDALAAKIDAIATGGVDYAALAKAVNDDAAARLAE